MYGYKCEYCDGTVQERVVEREAFKHRHGFQPTSPLPTLTDDCTTIDGYTQPGAAEATDGTPATLLIEINGASVGHNDGFYITSVGNVIRGLVINRFSRYGVWINGSGAMLNIISGNYIGTDAGGTTALGNGLYGGYISWGAQSNTIGGDTPGERNIISGNGYDGILINASNSNTVSGNYIGTDVNSTADLGNWCGVSIQSGAQNNVVGVGNVIAYNRWDGVMMSWDTTRNFVIQNKIFSNDQMGIKLWNGANGGIAAPVIVTTTLGSVNVVGTACPNCSWNYSRTATPTVRGRPGRGTPSPMPAVPSLSRSAP